MKIGHSIDANGYLTGDILEESGITPDVTVLCPDGFYKPRWVNDAWVEGLTQAEIDEIVNAPQPLSEIEKIKAEASKSSADFQAFMDYYFSKNPE